MTLDRAARSEHSLRVGIAIFMIASGIAVGANSPATAAADAPATSKSEPYASAARAGVPVEIEAARTPWTRVFANPNGSTTWEQTVEPRWVRNRGEWTDVDPTLQLIGEKVRPIATVLPIELSAGGTTDPVVMTTIKGQSFGLRWDGALPTPSLKGSVATYADVMPGIDLQIAVTGESFSELFVIKSRAAVRDSALAAMRLSVVADRDVNVLVDEGNRLRVLDSAGAPLLMSGMAQAWDSSGDPVNAKETGVVGTDMRTSRSLQPRDGDVVVPVRLSASGSVLGFEVSDTWLSSESTAFPVFIDPKMTTVSKTDWTMVSKTFPSASYWHWSGDQGVGHYEDSGSSPTKDTKRQLFSFEMPAALTGSTVSSATFSITQVYSGSCAAKPVDLRQYKKFTQNTTWTSFPDLIRSLDTRSYNYGRAGCANPNSATVEWAAKAAVQDAASTSAKRIFLGLRATDESDPVSWRRYKHDAKLKITYNHAPTVGARSFYSPSEACTTGAGRPVMSNTKPTFQTAAKDAENDSLTATFELQTLTGVAKGSFTIAAHSPATPFRYEMATALIEGSYRWRVSIKDSASANVVAPSWCEFVIDLSAPQPPTLSLSTGPYTVGQTITATFGSTATDKVGYRYSINNTEPTTPASGAPMIPINAPTATFQLTTFGSTTIRAFVYDSANRSAASAVEITVEGVDPVGQWELDDNAGISGTNSAPAGALKASALTLASGSGLVDWVNGRYHETDPGDATDYALEFTGSAKASATTAVINVDQAFTVGAWIRPSNASSISGAQSVVSETASVGTAMSLSVVRGPDVDDLPTLLARVLIGNTKVPANPAVAETALPELDPVDPDGAWVHVVATYDTTTDVIRIFVNGLESISLNATVSAGGVFAPVMATGPFTVAGGSTPALTVDAVRSYPGVVTEEEIFTWANQRRPS